uniref:Small ribosomal subunit protein bS18m n=1 Tax=Sphenodon punctatus TaxID=8508 RepID=A0A8D0H3Q0_SPHPU
MAALLVASPGGWIGQILAATSRGASAYCVVTGKRGYCVQHGQLSKTEDLPVEMENPYKEPPKKCVLCRINVDYKNVQLLSQFISPSCGRIYGRHITGLCNKKQREISRAIKRAQKTGFMSVMYKDPTFLSDPKICNI